MYVLNTFVHAVPDGPKLCEVCGSAAYKQLLLDTTSFHSTSPFTYTYNIKGYSEGRFLLPL